MLEAPSIKSIYSAGRSVWTPRLPRCPVLRTRTEARATLPRPPPSARALRFLSVNSHSSASQMQLATIRTYTIMAMRISYSLGRQAQLDACANDGCTCWRTNT
eukprot:IDg13898t1